MEYILFNVNIIAIIIKFKPVIGTCEIDILILGIQFVPIDINGYC